MQVLHSLGVMIPACHAGGPGSNPGGGAFWKSVFLECFGVGDGCFLVLDGMVEFWIRLGWWLCFCGGAWLDWVGSGDG